MRCHHAHYDVIVMCLQSADGNFKCISLNGVLYFHPRVDDMFFEAQLPISCHGSAHDLMLNNQRTLPRPIKDGDWLRSIP